MKHAVLTVVLGAGPVACYVERRRGGDPFPASERLARFPRCLGSQFGQPLALVVSPTGEHRESRRQRLRDLPVARVQGVRSPAQGPVRWLRAGVLTCAVVLLGCLAHMVGGQPPPSPRVLLPATVMIGLEAALLTRRRLPLPAVLGAMGVGQLLLHTLFMGCASHALASPGAMRMGAYHMTSGGNAAAAGMTAAPSPWAAHGGMSWPMLLAHAAATLVLALVLARGETTVWWLWNRVVVVLNSLDFLVIIGAQLASPHRDAARRPSMHSLLAADPRRGPPPSVVPAR